MEEQTWIATAWDAISSTGVTNLATAAGVIAALGLGLHATRERRRESLDEAQADARMVRLTKSVLAIDPVRSVEPLDQATGLPPITGHEYWIGCNYYPHGPDPILDVRFRVWLKTATGPAPAIEDKSDLVLADGKMHILGVRLPQGDVEAPDEVEVHAWCLIWSDRHGNRWAVDSVNQATPHRWGKNRKPRVNGSEMTTEAHE